MASRRECVFPGLISGKRALDQGFAILRESAAEYDERWTITVNLQRDKYSVSFPLPEATRAASRRPPYALQVWVNARTGEVAQIIHAS